MGVFEGRSGRFYAIFGYFYVFWAVLCPLDGGSAVARPDGVRPPFVDMVSAPESPFVFFKTARIYVLIGQRKNFPPSDIQKP